mmetsp:Transcript_47697/g.88647  ORF Transcript_47697/g.88647 Transcript_47697/m.88647 type:complete len:110 (-) Transcript_47697:188-517(-)
MVSASMASEAAAEQKPGFQHWDNDVQDALPDEMRQQHPLQYGLACASASQNPPAMKQALIAAVEVASVLASDAPLHLQLCQPCARSVVAMMQLCQPCARSMAAMTPVFS